VGSCIELLFIRRLPLSYGHQVEHTLQSVWKIVNASVFVSLQNSSFVGKGVSSRPDQCLEGVKGIFDEQAFGLGSDEDIRQFELSGEILQLIKKHLSIVGMHGELVSVFCSISCVEHGFDPREIVVDYDVVEGVEDDSAVLVEECEFE